MTGTPKKHRGNRPRAVARAAKYRTKRDDGDWAVQLRYELNDAQYALLTTKEHPDLVEIVNATKEAVNGQPGGAFYIDEYCQVLVPSTDGEYFVGGNYDELLEFDLDGEVISGRPPNGLVPGDEWDGPRVGIPYTLAAGGDDIRYEATFGDTVEVRKLSKAVGADEASKLARRLSAHKRNGGKIYINECREFFAPIAGDDGWRYIYLGSLGSDAWFPPPS